MASDIPPAAPADPPDPHAQGEAPAGAPDPAQPRSAYRNLWAPLVIIPALIVMVPVLIVVMFGGMGGSAKSVETYLDEIENGGANERQQALFGLTRQLLEWAADEDAEGGPGEEIRVEEILPRLEIAWERVREDEPHVRFVLAATFALLDHPEGVPRLTEVLTLSDAEDPGGELRYQALYILGSRGDPRAFESVRPYVHDQDAGLRAFAVIALQRMPLALVRETLMDALGDVDLVVRGNAAIALARLGDPAGAPVLVALLDPAIYADEHARDSRRFAAAALVGKQRLAVLEALASLRRPEDLARIQALATDDPDLNVRSAAKALERDWEAPAGGGN